MKLFARLFDKPRASPPTLPERIAILEAGSPDTIVDTALHAGEETLRLAAIGKLPDGEVLRGLAGFGASSAGTASASPPAVERAARTRMAQLIDAGAIDFEAYCDGARSRPDMLSVVALCQGADRLPQALASIQDPEQIAQLVVESPSSRLRQLAAESIRDPEQLRQLIPRVRNKDKNVYRILKQKCDVLNAEERKQEEIRNEIAGICAALERHSHRSYDPQYPTVFEHHKTRWLSLPEPPAADIDQRARAAIERCRQVIDAHLQQLANQAAAEAAVQSALELKEQEQQAARAAAAEQAEAQARAQQEAAAIRDAEEKQRAEQRAAEEQAFRQVGGLIRMANAALRDGGTQRAAGLRRSIDQKLPAAALPTYLSRQIEQLDEKLKELKQWKDYAVAPKRLELIGEMEALIGSSEGPVALAERIKSLQQDWRTISRGIVSEATEEWERFHRASQAAYQPCREHFEAQAKLRQQNLEKRQAVLERLLAFEAAQNVDKPDWRLLASVLGEAPQEWRRCFPVDRDAGRTVQEPFDEALRRLQAKLDTWHESNVSDKQSLIKRARHLLTLEDGREAIDAVKRLQLLWKETGPAPAAQSQSLWNEFREVCDSVYQKRQQAHAEYTSGLEANKSKAIALCEEIERVAASSGAALLEATAKIPEWRETFEALDEMPRTEARGLQDRFERAVESCKARIEQQRVRDTEQSFRNLFEAARSIHAYEWAVLRDAEPSEREALKQAAESFIAGTQPWPKGGLKAVKDVLAASDSGSEIDIESREQALRMLCVRGEIQSDTATPAEDEGLRRRHQVQRLTQAMGQGIGGDAGDWDAMALEWVRIGAIAPDVHENLRQRFMRCWEKRPMGDAAPTAWQGDEGNKRKSHDHRGEQTRSRGRDGSKVANRRW
ncbi:MAG TPA: DUF349 domain-containing protein [Steroidobacteraceae bacterium]|jgi:hypothetical protein|nr:DUF349 domain-containing protein [Steroidobacteraceae bacterium]